MFLREQIDLFSAVNKLSVEVGVEIFIVGGMIRDLYLSHDPQDKDVDFIVAGNAISFAEKFSQKIGGVLKKFSDFNTAKIVNLKEFGSIAEVDFASSRKETYPAPGKLPQVQMASISEDLGRRDFSFNALAVKLSDLLRWSEAKQSLAELKSITLDLYKGINDLEASVVRVLHDESFRDDPTRIFRAARYAARINGEIESRTLGSAQDAVKGGALSSISRQRIVNEIKKILEEASFEQALRILSEIGVIEVLSLYPLKLEERVLGMLSAAKTEAGSDSELFYQTALRIFFHITKNGKGPDLGLGANEIKKIESDTRENLDLSHKQTVQRLSKAGLLFQGLLKSK